MFFRSDCAANGPCDYKTDGKVVKKFSQGMDACLIDIYDMNNDNYRYDFIVYFTVGSNDLFG
ncbi:MAG TPA: hypothetical protein VFL76_03990 [Edaphocola sp.]|nr:hypothetical protein [Edaphocola sp.]